MILVSNDFKTAMKQPIKELDAYIELDEDNRLTSADDLISFKISCDSGMCKTAMRKLEGKYLGEHNLLGQWVHVGFGVRLPNGTFEYLDYGSFLIAEITTTKDSGITQIIGYDKMINSMKEYTKLNVTYPINLLEYTKSLCNACGLELGNTKLPIMDDWQITQELWENINGITYRDILVQIAQVTASTCIISNDDKVYFKSIYDTEETLTYDNMFKLKLEPLYGEINSVVLSRIPVEDNIYMRDDESIELNGLTEWKIQNNEIIDKDRDSAITPIYNAMHGISYYPFETSTEGLGWYEIADSFDIVNDTGDMFNITLFNFSIQIDGGIKEILKTVADTKTQTQYQYATTIGKRIKNTEYLVNKQEGYIQQVVEQTEENSKKITEGFQNIDEIRNSVSAIYDFTKTVSGKNQIKIENALDTNIIRLKIKPISNLKGLYPSKKLFPSKRLFPKSATSALTIVVSQKSKGISKSKFFPGKTLFPGKKLFPVGSNERKEFKFNLINPLKIYNNITDEFVIEFDNKKGTCIAKILRRIEKKGNIVTVYNSPKEELIKELDVELFKNQNYIFIKEFENFEFEATYLFNSELNKYYSTKVEANSRIQQKANELTLMVQEETDTDKLIAKINLKPGQIDMTGLVTANENFKILEDGSMEAKNGSFSGNIFLDDGSEIVGGKGLLSNLQFSSDGNSLVSKVGSYNRIGFSNDDMYQRNVKESLFIDVFIPENFTIVSAYLTLSIFPLRILNNGQEQGYGFAKKIKLYKSDMFGNMYADWNVGSGFRVETNENYIELKNALTDGSYTPDLNKKELQTIKSIDIGKNLNLGNSRLKIETANSTPPYNQDYIQNQMNCDFESCFASAKLNVIGYIKNEGGQEKWN